MSEFKYKFGDAMQKKLAAMLLYDEKGFVQNLEIVKPECFINPILNDVTKLIIQFFKVYDRLPTEDEFLEEAKARLQKDSRLNQDEYIKVIESILRLSGEDFSYIRDKAADIARYQAVKNAIIESADLLKRKQDYEGILKKVRSALIIGETQDLGVSYYETLEQRLTDRREGRIDRHDLAIPTMLGSLDRALGGGLCPGELGILMGPMKRGKSLVVAKFAIGALMHQKNVIYFGFEGNEKKTQTRFDAMISGVPKEELKEREDEVREAVNLFFGSAKKGQLRIKHFPAGGGSAWTIEAHLKRLQATVGFAADMVVVDYLGLMRVANKTMKFEGSSGGRYLMFGEITKELYSLAQKDNYALWLLHQATKQSLKKIIVGMGDSADSAEPMRDADVIVTLSQSKKEREMTPQRLRLYIAGGREMADNRSVLYEFEKSIGRLIEPDSEV